MYVLQKSTTNNYVCMSGVHQGFRGSSGVQGFLEFGGGRTFKQRVDVGDILQVPKGGLGAFKKKTSWLWKFLVLEGRNSFGGISPGLPPA